ncbi:hypothetical protein QR97_18680 [Streptomyces sp. PBH53]|uniref:SDR family oxidoreductase n=1 Tax=Streptomyces sp. PBH53 TaxID=1577075 RepID=UPI0006550163|nr:NAD(P)H-binding protein [Streptomyces sp. PBH53]AKN71559.1 hypothetical protein QR97_18680 [Streptomyces sp. PBH53]
MKIVVIGGTGLIGSQVVALVRANGHEAVPAAPSTGVDAVTGEGLARAVEGADVVVDVSNSPSFDAGPALDFFTRSARHLCAAEREAGVRHHVVLSIVGVDQVPDYGYYRAKVAYGLDRLGEITLAAKPDGRTVVTDETAGPFAGMPDVLTGDGAAHLASTRYEDWLRQH